MNHMRFNDQRWVQTFPHRVTPLSGEWLPGVVLRCDAINGWAGGTVLRTLQRENRSAAASLINWSAPSQILMELLAASLALTPARLVVTTFYREFSHLFETRPLRITHLVASGRFHMQMCPCCIAEAQYLHRTLALPGLIGCEKHRIRLQSHCRCQAPLQWFSATSVPFACPKCCCSWSDLPQIPLTEQEFRSQHYRLGLYTAFLQYGTPHLLTSVLLAIRERSEERTRLYIDTSWSRGPLRQSSLEAFVDAMMEMNMTTQEVSSFRGRRVRHENADDAGISMDEDISSADYPVIR